MLKISQGLTPSWFTLASDPDTRFMLKPLTSAERLNVIGISNDERLGEVILMTVRSSVTDFEGIVDDAGKPVPFSKDVLAQLPANVLAEISTEIIARSNLTAAEKKT